MFKNLSSLMSLVSALALSACASDALDAGSGTGAIIEVACAEGPECPAGFECEVEEEHGVVTSWCQADEDADPGCPPGYELEIEHGQAFCKPHGGDDDSAGDDNGGGGTDDPAGDDNGGGGTDDPAGDDNGGAGDDDAPQGDECAVNADCGGGLECEDGLCVPHGGDAL